MKYRYLYMTIFILILFLSVFNSSLYARGHNRIVVKIKNQVGDINPKIYGTNFIAYDPTTYENWTGEHYGYSDYGAGVWDPFNKEPVKEVINLAKDAGATIIRFPGGCGTHHYNWKRAVGKNREHFLYGIDEFLKSCQEIGAEAVFTISYFNGDEQDAADLVEYLNSPNNGKNPNAGTDWAYERFKNGHPLPYNVRYFEIGNEVWHGDHRNIKKVLPEEYARKYLKYYGKMKAVDPQIKIGIVLHNQEWNSKLLEIVKDKLDFGIMHIYPSLGVDRNKLEKMDAKDIFRITLGQAILRHKLNLQNTLKLLKEVSGRDIPLAITEYNSGFIQSYPVSYRHCLGTALLNAELLGIFMQPQNKILMANYWQFCNSYWGMIKAQENYMQHDYLYPINYIRRPNYSVLELYHRHFGSKLLTVEAESSFYKENNFYIPYLYVIASTNSDKSKIYLMVINKNLYSNITATIDLRDFKPFGKGKARILQGPSIAATNEEIPDNVNVESKEFEIESNPFSFTFKPHSLTALEIMGVEA